MTDNGYSYLHGLVQDRHTLRAVAQIDSLTRMGAPNTSMIKWAMPSAARSVYHLQWDCTRMAILPAVDDVGLTLVYTGPDGRVGQATAAGLEDTTVAPPGDGPDVHGVIRDLQTIGDGVYAVGMARQVYRRDRSGTWARHDAGVLQSSDEMALVGFNAIHGRDEATLYAVGFGGEIWCREAEQWRPLESPVASILNAVHVLPDGRVLVAGQHGALALLDSGGWRTINTEIETQIWDIQPFGDAIYIATSDALYRLASDLRPKRVDMGLGTDVTCGQLHAADGVLLSTGRKHQCWSDDGIAWHAIT
ncbi:hypothetical protein [Luteimonas sp. FCS-9]|uniref:hypothetical protein n=1 Tax=Luteimonas sp. FCS-9 TaxID=1547516 RepID=UPI00063EBD1B|nr:hypothetical protein [Luteimonas sp. FCS-9]KLI99286.1 hypothetical protein WQ56_12865 [Luteimonas sp. FCS-9]